jgi:hypothetical protein
MKSVAANHVNLHVVTTYLKIEGKVQLRVTFIELFKRNSGTGQFPTALSAAKLLRAHRQRGKTNRT